MEQPELKSLTKENFFNELGVAFPDLLKQFCDWIDVYKKRVHWEDLFLSDTKFHHLPLEMQTGIIYQFFSEVFDEHNIGMFDVTNNIEVVETIREVFAKKFMDDQVQESIKD